MANLYTMLTPALIAAWLILGLVTAAHAIMYKRDPKGAAIWVFFSFGMPIVGPWLYWVMGINRVERRALRRRGRQRGLLADQVGLTSEPVVRDSLAVGHLTALRSVSDRVTGLPLLPGNHVQPLHNGEETYPQMLGAIGQATRSITLMSYIFDWDEVGREFAGALQDAADRGVRVHILIDGIGALGTFSRMGRLLLKSGAAVATFFPLRLPLGRLRLNLRNHRKILVVDGHTGFTGGMNISEKHLLQRAAPDRIEDLHFRITGPVVAEMQQSFCEDWFLATEQQLAGEKYFPPLPSVGPALCRTISSGPDEQLEKTHWILQGALASAQQSVRIVTPYFIPSQALIGAIVMAALRGVQVTLILPSQLDHQSLGWASDAFLWELLLHGVHVVKRRPPFVHTKLMIVDERWILLGSANLDRRSFRLNFEFNVEVYDLDLAASLGAWLDGLVAQSDPVTLQDVDGRPKWRRLRDGCVKLFSPYL